MSLPSLRRRGLRGGQVTHVFNSIIAFIKAPLLTTLSAIIATLPLILLQFGRLSLVAPLVNVLILWLVPWLMLAGFMTLVAGFIFLPVAQVLAVVTHFGLAYVILIVSWFGRQTWSATQFQLPWWGMAFLYSGLFYTIVRKSKVKTAVILKTDSHQDEGSPRAK